jgi:hypothetical protein
VEWFIFWLIINAVVGFLIGQQKNDVATAIVLSIPRSGSRQNRF